MRGLSAKLRLQPVCAHTGTPAWSRGRRIDGPAAVAADLNSAWPAGKIAFGIVGACWRSKLAPAICTTPYRRSRERKLRLRNGRGGRNVAAVGLCLRFARPVGGVASTNRLRQCWRSRMGHNTPVSHRRGKARMFFNWTRN